MRNTVKTFFAQLYVLLFTFTLLGCNSKKMDEKIVLLSEPMQNRFVDDGKSPKHDKDCIAFNKTHFSPTLITTEYFTTENYKRLAKITGLNWTKQIINDSVIDFTHYFSENINKAVYISEVVYSDKAGEKYITAGSDDGFVLWVNGDSVFAFHKGNAILPEDYIIPIKLKEGNNILLYKIDQGDGGWAFCRKIISKEELEQRIRAKVNILYADLPESCILPDNSLYLPLKPDHRRKLDFVHNIKLTWLDKDHKEILKQNYKCSEMPDSIKLPVTGEKVFILKTEITESGKKVFSEEIQIMLQREAERLAREFTQRKPIKDNPNYDVRVEAVHNLFKIGEYKTSTILYSTRTKAQALFDLMLTNSGNETLDISFPGPRVFGYKSKNDNSFQVCRAFLPADINKNKKYKLLFITRGIAKEEDNFWRSYEGKTHSLMAQRAAFSSKYGLIIVMTHGRGTKNYLGIATEEIPIIIDDLSKLYNIDKENISLFSGSSGPMLNLELLKHIKISLKYLGFMSPILSSKDIVIQNQLTELKNSYPNLKLFIRHALEDSDAPISTTRKWVRKGKELLFDINYKEIPHSTHWHYLEDPEEEFIKYICR